MGPVTMKREQQAQKQKLRECGEDKVGEGWLLAGLAKHERTLDFT
jgi:hypothetical protein